MPVTGVQTCALPIFCLAFAALFLTLFLLPGFGTKVNALTGVVPLHSIVGLLAVAACTAAVVSHARRVPFGVLVERVLLGVGLGIVCIIIFVDGLGLTMKSVIVTDAWNALKNGLIRPIISLIFR